MAMYVCDVCGCLENSSNGNWWFRFRDDAGVAKCSMCAYGEWRSQFTRRPWDGIAKVENRSPMSGEMLDAHVDSLYKPDSWFKDFVHIDDAMAGNIGVVAPMSKFTLYVWCANGIQVDVRRLCHVTVIRHKDYGMCFGGPRDYTRAKLSISDLGKVARSCKFNVRDLTITNQLIDGPTEEEHSNLFQLLTTGVCYKL